jgi:hypothetical protein
MVFAKLELKLVLMDNITTPTLEPVLLAHILALDAHLLLLIVLLAQLDLLLVKDFVFQTIIIVEMENIKIFQDHVKAALKNALTASVLHLVPVVLLDITSMDLIVLKLFINFKQLR